MPPDPSAPAPLILTLALDHGSQAWFDALRAAYFPPERLQVGAHVTLFHALPGEREADVVRMVAGLCAGSPRFGVRVSGLRFLGRGVAFALQSAEAARLRQEIAGAFRGEMTRQDQAGWSAHVTIQNKVTPEVARRTEGELARLAWPGAIVATGVDVWRYRGGPWELLRSCSFEAENV